MKNTTLRSLCGGTLIALALIAAPVTTFALDAKATTTSSFSINHNGIAHIVGAEVTSVTGNVVNAVTRIKNTVISWAFATDATTKITAHNSVAASPADIRVGDRINVTGVIAAIGSTMSVQASAIKDVTSMKLWKARSGTVQSVNAAQGTFVLKSNDKLITVQTNAQTTWKTNATSSVSLAALPVNSKVTVTGQTSVDGLLMTASSVHAKNSSSEKKHADKDKREHVSGWNNGKHLGLIKAHLGFGNNDR